MKLECNLAYIQTVEARQRVENLEGKNRYSDERKAQKEIVFEPYFGTLRNMKAYFPGYVLTIGPN